MSKHLLGKRSDVAIAPKNKTERYGHNWWTMMKPCPVCRKVDGKRVYLITNGKEEYCAQCARRNDENG